jgi:hypothetical protein
MNLESEWEPQEPPRDFAERVVAAATRETRARRVRRIAIAGGAVAVLAAAAVLAVVVLPDRPPSRGDVRAERRIEVPIGDRAVAVLEPGAHVSWYGDVVEQHGGDVFYRVNPGGAFEVRTQAATAAVLGTCFRITIDSKENVMKRRDVGAGAIGALAAAVVVVGVYEGKVQVSHGKEAVTVGAGERAVADGTGVRADRARPAVAVAPAPRETPRSSDELRERLKQLEAERVQLEQELTTAYDAVGKHPYDLAPEDWAQLAKEGAFKYQMPCFRKGGFRPTDEQLGKLGLQAKDADVIQTAYRNANERFGKDMLAICAAAFGPATSDISDCITKLFTNLYKEGQARTTFTQAAEIRGGAKQAPADASAALRMLLVMSGSMQGFEAELAQTYGADEAHRIAYSDELCYQAQTLR